MRSLTVKELKQILEKYDDSAVVMVGNREEDTAVEADSAVSYCYATDDGQIVDEFDSTYEDTFVGKNRALIIWAIES